MSTDVGCVRSGNEDFCAALPDLGVYVVCDGMGGAAAGEVASHLAAERFLRSLQPATPERRGAASRLRRAIEAANDAVYRRSKEDVELDGMGTTLVGALFEPGAGSDGSRGRMWIAHVGDSRCYLLRGKLMHLLTLDHSVVEEQVRAGFMSASEAASSPMRHVITRAVGAHPTVEPEIQSIEAYPGDLLLLASDGLNRELHDEDIHQILHQIPGSPDGAVLERACKSLVDAANATGGYDNVTVLLIYVT